jgi:hypothetical protein
LFAVMIVYHATTAEAAAQIMKSGFRDSTGTYLTGREWAGVWVSDRPLGMDEGAKGHVLLRVDLRVSEAEIAQYEWVQEDFVVDGEIVSATYREWLAPADVLNSGTVAAE